MKITVESTEKLLTLVIDGVDVPARVWQGHTESGTPVFCFITRISPEIPPTDPRNAEFQRELKELAAPRPAIKAFDARFIL